MRCDVNLSIRRRGETALGTRTEMKNLNSFAFTAKAIAYEFQRQVEAVEAGETIVQETRRFDAATGKTHAMRSKENADDYRYFPDPDLPPIHLDDAEIEAIRESLPELPEARKARLMAQWGLTAQEAGVLCAQPVLGDAFEAAAPLCREPSRLWSLVMGEIARLLPDDTPVPFAAEDLAALSNLISEGTVHLGAAKQILPEMLRGQGTPAAIVEALGLAQVSDARALGAVIDRVLAENAPLVATYLGGKAKALQALMGRVMAATGGRANPVLAAEILAEKLSAKKA